ncbi:hypothetical protein VC83_08168 [Pseudogymnoascus destructans]|uniref:Uncharacterized protein n=2 Tax=Pseudogymnoascus destructans TaxID=655981 RepID=L8FZS9_PSED2|nr:uncharacterized protein VC83_08168 [Pseudogymnoascus destructans]ELR05978.1 hypothetical protein GMDG_01939 [Pseudogymnoascus destructans 20631-21]OAF55302.1 hypothetical protein VC83_08168 [Pseudogymnoascus destructans]
MEGSSGKPLGKTGVPLLEEEAQANAQTQTLEPPQQAAAEDNAQTQAPEPQQQAAAENEGSDEERVDLRNLTEEDAESLVGVSMNWALTRRSSLQSTIPGSIAEVELEGGEFLESDEERPSQQTTTSEKAKLTESSRAEHRETVVEGKEEKRSSFRAKISTKRRSISISGGGESLRKLLPSLSGSIKLGLQKARNKATGGSSYSSSHQVSGQTSDQATPVPGGTAPSDVSGTGSPHKMESKITLERERTPDQGTTQPPLLRVISDSMLYSSLSRISSLGDDSRFENNHQMINSRRKALSDSLQDKSFKMPTMPSLPNLKEKFNAISGYATRPPDESSKGKVLSDAAKGQSLDAKATLSSDKMKVFDRVIEHLTGDVVVLGGYRGSILKSTKASDRPLWIPPVGVGLNLGTVDLEVGLEDEDDERMEESVYASGMLRNIGVVDISRRLIKRLRGTENAKNGTLRVWDYGYDWRLNPHLLSRKLKEFLEGLPCNVPGKDKGALVIAHSLGGLITRHVVNQRPELFSGVIYAGVPQSCINIIGPLRNGDSVGFNQRIFTAQVNFTLRTSLVLLPLDGYGYIDKVTKEPYHIDFFDVNDWIKYRISPCTDQPMPARNPPNPSIASAITSSLTSLTIPRKNPSPPPPATGVVAKTTGQSTASKAMEKVTSPLRKRKKAKKQSDATPPSSDSPKTSPSVLPRSAAVAYLTRILPVIKQFKLELAHRPDTEVANKYPPLAVIYAKNTPTVCAAKVDDRDAIPCADVYNNLAFASGDGVCLAKDAQLPYGYRYVLNGRIRTERGHVTMLGDLEAVGKAIEAVYKGRELGIGLGLGNNEIWD